MSAFQTALVAYFRPSFLFSVRHAILLVWAAYVLFLVASTLANDGTPTVLAWAMIIASLLVQQYGFLLHRVTTGVAANLVPGYRRAQWRAFTVMMGLVAVAVTVLCAATALNPVTAAGASILFVGAATWLNFRSRTGFVILQLTPVIALIPFVLFEPAFSIGPVPLMVSAAAALVGLAAFVLAGRHYLNGGTILTAAHAERRLGCAAKPGIGGGRPRFNAVNHWLLDRLLDRGATRFNEPARIGAGLFAPVWGSGIASLLLYVIVAAVFWLLNPVFAPDHGFDPAAVDFAASAGFFALSAGIATACAVQFHNQRQAWQALWLVVPAAGRIGWTARMVGAFLLVELWCFVALSAGFVTLAALVADMPWTTIVAQELGALGLFVSIAGAMLVIMPFAGRLHAIGRIAVFATVWLLTLAIGFFAAAAFTDALPLAGQLGVALLAVCAFNAVLVGLAVRWLARTELALRDA